MEPTKEDLAIERAYIDQTVLDQIKAVPGVKFGELWDAIAPGRTSDGYRILDPSLQRLRKKGLIRYEGGGWRVC